MKCKKRNTYPAGTRCYFLTTILDTELLVARPGMSYLQLFPVSSLLIGSTLLVDSIADGTPALINLERSWVWAPGEPDCACLFRLLESILCSVREDSCYYNTVLFSSSIPSFSVFVTSGTEQNSFLPPNSFGTLHPLSYEFTYIHLSPKAILHPWRDVIHSVFKEIRFTLLQTQLCSCAVTPHPHYNYITVSMDIHFGNIWKCSAAHKK